MVKQGLCLIWTIQLMQKFDPDLLKLQTHLDRLYQENAALFSFKASNLADFETWQQPFRSQLKQLVGIEGRNHQNYGLQIIRSDDHPFYTEQFLGMTVAKGEIIPMYVLVPKKDPPYRSILVFHGHDPSAQYCLGNYPDERTKKQNLANDNNYAQVLAEAGYLVCVVEQRGMGDRITEQISTENGRSCRHLAFSYLLHGRTLLGERILDGMAALSYLESRTDVIGNPGCTGHSGGGTTALWLAALDERIRALVISGCFSSFKGSILAMEHCECNYVPGILTLGEMGDLAALIAPRPLCIIHGEKDPIYPVKCARSEFQKVNQAYLIHQQPNQAKLFIHGGGHAYHHQAARDWFDQYLV